jgi:glycogen debranching enzyme
MIASRRALRSSTLRNDNASLACDLTNADLFDFWSTTSCTCAAPASCRTAHCYERPAVRNFDERQRQVRIDIAFAADFADLFEVRRAAPSTRDHTDA